MSNNFDDIPVTKTEDSTILHISPKDLARRLMQQDYEENGTQYYLCANCGQHYILGQMGDPDAEDWQDTTVCSPGCWSAYLAYINNPDF